MTFTLVVAPSVRATAAPLPDVAAAPFTVTDALVLAVVGVTVMDATELVTVTSYGPLLAGLNAGLKAPALILRPPPAPPPNVATELFARVAFTL